MKKNVIRITESELKNYIRKIVSEQTQPKVDVNKAKAIMAELVGENVQLYLDHNNTQKGKMVRIDNITPYSDYSAIEEIKVTDWSIMDGNDQPIKMQQGQTKLYSMSFDCDGKGFWAKVGTETANVGAGEPSKFTWTSMSVSNKKLEDKFKELMGCAAPADRTAKTYASAPQRTAQNFG